MYCRCDTKQCCDWVSTSKHDLKLPTCAGCSRRRRRPSHLIDARRYAVTSNEEDSHPCLFCLFVVVEPWTDGGGSALWLACQYVLAVRHCHILPAHPLHVHQQQSTTKVTVAAEGSVAHRHLEENRDPLGLQPCVAIGSFLAFLEENRSAGLSSAIPTVYSLVSP